MSIQNNETLVMLGAKVPPRVRDVISKIADRDERSVSRTVSKLLESHPAVVAELSDQDSKITLAS
ncbi:MAG TPA: hypothetical protein PLX39_15430 [Pyrinomonadaceae bacterium]|nr:hypothetical protein [Pyrinomonadaceae bacterium]